MNSLNTDYGFCEICDNATPRTFQEGELACLYCWEAYGEIN